MALIEMRTGDILAAEVEAIVNPVNCVGVMGRGLALQFKSAYPANFTAYKAACDNGLVRPGQMFVVDTGRLVPRYIVNFPTKRHWRDNSLMQDIDDGLAALSREVRERRITSIGIPPLGAGLGGLPWDQVLARITATFQPVPGVAVEVYLPR